MRIVVLGAGGFIGRHIVGDLLSAGHQVVAVVREATGFRAAFPQAAVVAMDLATAVHPSNWRAVLVDVEVVVNAAGLLGGRDIQAIHVDMPAALTAAASTTSVRRLVLISAISARADVATDYARSKLAGEAALRRAEVGWTILRPSLVYGDGSYGGTSLLRGLAGLPLFVPLPGSGDFAFTPIHVRDLAHAIRRVCEDAGFERRTLEPVGPETLPLRTLLARYRAWLGFGHARFLPVPMPLMRAVARLGDLVGDGPVSSNSLAQMIAGNAGDSAAFADAIGFKPRSLESALQDRPAQVQDRWHARLFFLSPALRAMLVLMWLVSAWLGLRHGAAATTALVHGLGLSSGWGDPLRIGGSMGDEAIAGLLVVDRTARWSTPVQLAAVLGYTVVIGAAMPALWLDPLGPLPKNLPIMLAIAVHGAIGNKR